MGGDLVLCKTKEMAKALQYVVSRQIDQGIFRAERFKQKKPLHLKAYAESWLKKQTHLMAATYRDYESYLRRYINPALGDIFIDDITTGMLGDFMKALPVAPKTKKNILGCIMKILRDAKIAGDITELPEKPIQRGKDKVIDPEVIWIEPEAQNAILDQLREIHRPLFMFLMLSGCRPSEARALRWVDIHAERSEIIVAKTFDYKGNLVPVKGKKILPIPMTEGLHYLFENITRNLSPYVFANPLTGRPYRRDALDKIWRKACKKALGDVVPLYSSTRHSYASQLVNAGVDVAIVQRLLRHTDVRITKRYYEYKTSPLRISVENVRSIFDVRKTVSKPSVNSNDDGKEVIN
jgi:integrase